jgi:Ankyrin repeats (3 copies)/Ankyrin repeat
VVNEEQAVEKIRQIEAKIRDSILSETTTIRTKHAITIASQYPTRHVQIVFRLYKSVSEILTGFDVDCSCVAYDGHHFWAAPRGVAAYVTQTNTIDLSRRSPSYENRLSKYSHRGFEVYWPLLDRSKIDPTIFERSFSRVMGLARLLVYEKLPGPNDRDIYLAKRRAERGRPPLPWNYRKRKQLHGNVKESQPDDVAEWVEEDEVSNYHTFTVPYGPKYNAKKIEKLLFTKDLLLNAEWNKPKDREATIHRHPAFFGSVNDVIHDCCSFCPEPRTDEDFLAAKEESKIFISGNMSFLKDDPGRQAIGSFNPTTEDDWTEMAYVGNAARLCQAIVDGDLEHVEDWCKQEGADVNRRDNTRRTPLHLATTSSTPDTVQCLINHGARPVARLVDSFTALHTASRRGNTAMVKAILEKSKANEEEEVHKDDLKKEVRRAARQAERKGQDATSSDVKMKEDNEDMEDDELMEDSDSLKSDRMTEGSFVKISGPSEDSGTPDTDNENEADVYDVNVLAWDYPVSPLHLAVMGGHLDVIELLVSIFGADVLLPVKLLDSYNHTPGTAILTLVLA